MRILGWIVAGLMTAAIVYGFITGTGFGEEGSQILALAWGRVTIVDLYLMLGIFAAWIWHREQRMGVALLWTMALIGLGSVAAGAYLVRASMSVGKKEV